MSGQKGQLRAHDTRERVARRVQFYRECGWSWKEIAAALGRSERQAQRYMSCFSGYMSHNSGSQAGTNRPSLEGNPLLL